MGVVVGEARRRTEGRIAIAFKGRAIEDYGCPKCQCRVGVKN